jgi:hypothetical protein
MPYEPASYGPTFVEWSIFIAGLAFFCLLITIAIKIFPMLAVWEMTEEHEYNIARAQPTKPLPAEYDKVVAAMPQKNLPRNDQSEEGREP